MYFENYIGIFWWDYGSMLGVILKENYGLWDVLVYFVAGIYDWLVVY